MSHYKSASDIHNGLGCFLHCRLHVRWLPLHFDWTAALAHRALHALAYTLPSMPHTGSYSWVQLHEDFAACLHSVAHIACCPHLNLVGCSSQLAAQSLRYILPSMPHTGFLSESRQWHLSSLRTVVHAFRHAAPFNGPHLNRPVALAQRALQLLA